MLSALTAQAFAVCGARVASAQDDTPGWNKTQTTPKEKVESPSTPRRPPKTAAPRHQRRRPRGRQTASRVATPALLSLQYRVLKVERNGSQIEVNPITVFNPEDRFRFGFKPDSDGFLYIIQQTDPNQPGTMLFPDSSVNGGQNFVRKGQEFTVPSGCMSGVTSWDCSYRIDGVAGQDFYTIIFSRDATPNLPPDAMEADGDIKPEALRRHWTTSGQKLSAPRRGDTIFSLRVNNLNPAADAELTVRYLLNKRGRAGAAAATVINR